MLRKAWDLLRTSHFSCRKNLNNYLLHLEVAWAESFNSISQTRASCRMLLHKLKACWNVGRVSLLLVTDSGCWGLSCARASFKRCLVSEVVCNPLASCMYSTDCEPESQHRRVLTWKVQLLSDRCDIGVRTLSWASYAINICQTCLSFQCHNLLNNSQFTSYTTFSGCSSLGTPGSPDSHEPGNLKFLFQS